MDPFVELTTELSLLTQQLRVSHIVNEHHQIVRNQMLSPRLFMHCVRYGGAPYLSNFTVGWDNHLRTSCDERQDTSQSPHVQRSSLEDTC